jgi:hypothetical protein
VRTTGPSIHVWILLIIALVGTPFLTVHFGTAGCVAAGILILTASIIRLRGKAARARYLGNQAAGTKAARALAAYGIGSPLSEQLSEPEASAASQQRFASAAALEDTAKNRSKRVVANAA